MKWIRLRTYFMSNVSTNIILLEKSNRFSFAQCSNQKLTLATKKTDRIPLYNTISKATITFETIHLNNFQSKLKN